MKFVLNWVDHTVRYRMNPAEPSIGWFHPWPEVEAVVNDETGEDVLDDLTEAQLDELYRGIDDEEHMEEDERNEPEYSEPAD